MRCQLPHAVLDFCITEKSKQSDRLKIREKGKRKFKNKVKQLIKQVKAGTMTSKEAYKYLSGHLGYIKIANTKNLEDRLFYNENVN